MGCLFIIFLMETIMLLKELLAYIFTADFLQLFENVSVYNEYEDNKGKYIDTGKLRFNAPGKTYISRVRGVFEPSQNDYTLENIGESWVRSQLAIIVMESFGYLNNTDVIKPRADAFMDELLECCKDGANSHIDDTVQSDANTYVEQQEEKAAVVVESKTEMTEGEFVGFCNKIQDEQGKPLYEIVDFGGTGRFMPGLFEYVLQEGIMTIDQVMEMTDPLTIFGRTRSNYDDRIKENIALVFLYHVMSDVVDPIYIQIAGMRGQYSGEIEPDYNDYGYGEVLKNVPIVEKTDKQETDKE